MIQIPLFSGVLVPPSFGVVGTPSQKGLGPSLPIHHRLMQASRDEPLSYFTYLQETDLSTILIKDHMQTGVWIAPQAGTNTSARISVYSEKPQRRGDEKTHEGHLFLEHKVHPATIQVRAPSGNGSPAASCSIQALPCLCFFAGSTPNGKNWAGTHFDHTFHLSSAADSVDTHPDRGMFENYEGLDTMCRNTVNAKLGAWTPLYFRKNRGVGGENPLSIHGYAAVNALGATAAVHGALHQGSAAPTIRSYLSVNLSDADRPPLQVTLSQMGTTSSIALTQVVSFDRIQFNVMEDRAPFVRNTAAWTVRMENDRSIAETPTSAKLEVAGAWQVNRALALKAVYDKWGVLTTAVMFKRWHYPRVTCSLLHRWEGAGPVGRWGFGIELETGGIEGDPSAYYYAHHPSPAETIDSEKVPPTRAVLPGER